MKRDIIYTQDRKRIVADQVMGWSVSMIHAGRLYAVLQISVTAYPAVVAGLPYLRGVENWDIAEGEPGHYTPHPSEAVVEKRLNYLLGHLDRFMRGDEEYHGEFYAQALLAESLQILTDEELKHCPDY